MNKRTVSVVTPENIVVEYELAGLGSRFLAVALDHLIQAILMAAGLIAITAVSAGAGMAGRVLARNIPFWGIAVGILWFFTVLWGYFIVFELWWAGSTPGKRAIGLRVVRDGGYPVDLFAVAVRNIVRIADLLPPFYGVGMVSIFLSREHKRLGDWAAGTVVIKERRRSLPSVSVRPAPNPSVRSYMEQLPASVDLTPAAYAAVRRFVERRAYLPIPVQAYVAMRLTRRVLPDRAQKAEVGNQLQYADMLEAVLRKYMDDHGLF